MWKSFTFKTINYNCYIHKLKFTKQKTLILTCSAGIRSYGYATCGSACIQAAMCVFVKYANANILYYCIHSMNAECSHNRKPSGKRVNQYHLVYVISHCGASVNIEQVVIMFSSSRISCVPVRPPINRTLFSLIWTDIPK